MTVLFSDFNLDANITRALTAAGFEQPTPIQAEALPVLLEGRDLMASAATGTGKTAAFLLPALHRIASTPRPRGYFGPRMLVLVPTRELAQQVSAAAESFGKNLQRFTVVTLVGGVPYPVQNRLLARPVEVVIATPGRLLDHLSRGRLDLSQLEVLVLDEADRMLDMGFIEDVQAIASATPSTRQTALFSATLDGAVGRLAHELLTDPARIQLAAAAARRGEITEKLHFTDDLMHKGRMLDHLLADETLQQAIIFTATKLDADDLAARLATQGFMAAALHGDMAQRDRQRTIKQMREGRVKLLVATDVAARGIDVDGISHVINFDLPKNAEDYVHRIGRTGRAGRSGTAISLVSPAERGLLKRIERFTGQRLEATVVAGLEPRARPQSSKPRFGGGGGGYGGNRNGGYGGNRGFGGNREGGSRFGGNREGGFGGNREGGFGGGNREGGFGGNREGGASGNRDGRFGGNREGGFGGNREGRFGGNREGGFGGNREGGSRDGQRGGRRDWRD